MSHHSIDLSYDGDDERPTVHFRCDAPAGAPCKAVYDCPCETWYEEGAVHGKPYHRDSEDVMHTGKFVDECRLDDWFYTTDEALSGNINIPVKPEWIDGYYIFHVGGAS